MHTDCFYLTQSNAIKYNTRTTPSCNGPPNESYNINHNIDWLITVLSHIHSSFSCVFFKYFISDRQSKIENKAYKTKTIGPSVFTLIYFPDVGLSVCPSFLIFGCSLISHELLNKTYIYAHHQNGLNEGIKIMCFICRFNVYFSRNRRKCSQNGEDENFKF